MKEIIEYLGSGLLYASGGIAAIGIIIVCTQKGGMIYTMVAAFMQGMTG